MACQYPTNILVAEFAIHIWPYIIPGQDVQPNSAQVLRFGTVTWQWK